VLISDGYFQKNDCIFKRELKLNDVENTLNQFIDGINKKEIKTSVDDILKSIELIELGGRCE
jgi:hypothetical protein